MQEIIGFMVDRDCIIKLRIKMRHRGGEFMGINVRKV